MQRNKVSSVNENKTKNNINKKKDINGEENDNSTFCSEEVFDAFLKKNGHGVHSKYKKNEYCTTNPVPKLNCLLLSPRTIKIIFIVLYLCLVLLGAHMFMFTIENNTNVAKLGITEKIVTCLVFPVYITYHFTHYLIKLSFEWGIWLIKLVYDCTIWLISKIKNTWQFIKEIFRVMLVCFQAYNIIFMRYLTKLYLSLCEYLPVMYKIIIQQCQNMQTILIIQWVHIQSYFAILKNNLEIVYSKIKSRSEKVRVWKN